MRLPSRIASAILAVSLAVSAFCMPASAAKYSTLTFPDAAGNQVTYLDQQYQNIAELPIGTQIILTGIPDYNAAYNDGQYNYVGFNTDKGTWYIRLGSSSVDALKKIVPDDGSITEFTACGTYVGLLAANGLPVVDLALGQALVYNAQAGGDTVHALADELPRYQQESMKPRPLELPLRLLQPSRLQKKQNIPVVDCPMRLTQLLASWFGSPPVAAPNTTLILAAAV